MGNGKMFLRCLSSRIPALKKGGEFKVETIAAKKAVCVSHKPPIELSAS